MKVSELLMVSLRSNLVPSIVVLSIGLSTLMSGQESLTGRVLSGGKAIPGATVTAHVGGKTVSTVTE